MPGPLPSYSGDNTTCPKCSHTEAITRHRAAGEHGSSDEPTFGRSPKGERLERACWRCDYVWDEALNPPTGRPTPDCDEICGPNPCGECGRCLLHQPPAEGGCYPREEQR